MRPAKKSQVIHNVRRCTTLQGAQAVPLGSCSAEAPLLAPPEGDAHLHTVVGGKRGGGNLVAVVERNQVVTETPRKPGATRWKSLFNYCRKQSGWQGHGHSIPPGSAEPSSALPSLQGDAQLGGTSSREGTQLFKNSLAIAKPRGEKTHHQQPARVIPKT